MSALNLKAMQLDDLLSLRDQIDQLISGRIEDERRELATKMARLDQFLADRSATGNAARKNGPLPPKYCNPSDPRETWAGRGRLPRWMEAALKSGKTIDDFRIDRVLAKKK